MEHPWWVDGVVYQIYPRSFADSNGDGIGDLPGITARLDHLAWLGIDAIWLSPITVSPNKDWGYDVADYCDVDPALGTLDDLDELVAEATRRNIRIVLDLVPNHSSDQHPWFVDARSSRESKYRDWYVWADGDPPGRADGAFPNNWVSAFGGPAWSFDELTSQWYLHHFVPEQPDLNWWNDDLVQEFDRILRFWFDRGIAGFRIDVCHMIVKDRHLRDNPPVDFWTDHESERFDAERPELHDVLRRWRRIAEEYDPPRLLLGETYIAGADRLARFYGAGDELNLAFNFPFFKAPFHAQPLAGFVADTEAALPAGAWPVWTGSNHDHSRFPTRWAQNDPRRIRLGLLLLLTLRGTAVLYYGDEIGMPDTPDHVDPAPRPRRPAPLAGGRRPRPGAHPHAVARRRRRRLHRAGRGAVAADRLGRGRQRGRAAGGSELDPQLLPAAPGPPARARRSPPGELRAPGQPGGDVGLPPWPPHDGGAEPVRRDAGRRSAGRGGADLHHASGRAPRWLLTAPRPVGGPGAVHGLTVS